MSYKLNNNAYVNTHRTRENYNLEDDVFEEIVNMFKEGGASIGFFDIPPGALSHLIFKHSGHPPTQTGEGDPEVLRLPLLISPEHVKNNLKVARIKGTNQKIFILGDQGQYNNIIDEDSVSSGYLESVE